MPRHLISDAHEWINEIPTVPIYYLDHPEKTTESSHSSHYSLDHFLYNLYRVSTALTGFEKKRQSSHSSHYSLDQRRKRISFLYNLYPVTTALTSFQKEEVCFLYSLNRVTTTFTQSLQP